MDRTTTQTGHSFYMIEMWNQHGYGTLHEFKPFRRIDSLPRVLVPRRIAVNDLLIWNVRKSLFDYHWDWHSSIHRIVQNAGIEFFGFICWWIVCWNVETDSHANDCHPVTSAKSAIRIVNLCGFMTDRPPLKPYWMGYALLIPHNEEINKFPLLRSTRFHLSNTHRVKSNIILSNAFAVRVRREEQFWTASEWLTSDYVNN